jgi:predicted thioesterase
MAQIPIGTVHEQGIVVTRELTVNFMGTEEARVLATPQMIGLLEHCCRNAVAPFLDPGYDTVGTHVDLYHLAASPVGMRVSFRAEVTAVEDRRIRFKVSASDEVEKIGEGIHERAIVNVARFGARVQEKFRQETEG